MRGLGYVPCMNLVFVMNLFALIAAVVTAVCTAVAASNGMWRPGEPDEEGKKVIDGAKLVGVSAGVVAAILKLIAELVSAWG